MVKVLKKRVLLSTLANFILLLCSCENMPIISDREELKKEIVPLRVLLRKIRKSSSKEAAEARGEVVGKFEEMIRRSNKADQLLVENTILKMEKNDFEYRLKVLEVPIVFRNYVTKIEYQFVNIKAQVPQKAMKNQHLHMSILQRKYNWIEILTKDEHSNNVYVKLIKADLKNEFFSQEKISLEKEIEDLTPEETAKYEKFLDDFCQGIAVSVDYVNKIIAHKDFGRHPGNDLHNVFKMAHNKYVSLFYRAVVG